MSRERQQKKEQFEQSQKKGWSGKVFVLIAAIVAVVGIAGFFFTQGETDAYARVTSVDGEVRLDLDQINDGQAHYFRYASAKGELKFFVVKSADGVVRAAFDACDVCYREKKGYRQEGNVMVCNNCNMKFHTNLINDVKGGCNPAPLQRRIDGSQLVITDKALLTGAWFFSG